MMFRRRQSISIYVAYIIIFAVSIGRDVYVFRNSTSIDLLYRVVGSRLMKDGQSPYYGKWHANETNAERYYHPVPRYSQRVNGVTVTPAILWLHSPWADNDFCSIAKVWFYLQLMLLFLSGLLILFSFKAVTEKTIALIVFSIFFCFSRNLYLHLHSAQVYLLYGFLFALIFALLRSRVRTRFILTGVVLAIAVWLKPFFIFAVIPLVWQRNWKLLKGFIAMAAILLLQIIVTHQTNTWRSYARAMPEYAADIFSKNDSSFLQIQPPPFPVADCIYPMKTPTGISMNATGLVSLQYYLKRFHLPVEEPTIFGLIAFAVALMFGGWFRHKQQAEQLIALMFLCYLVAELCTPAMRMGYYLVEWLTAATMVVACFKQERTAAVIMILGLAINNGYLPIFGVQSGAAGEAIMIVSLLAFLSAGQKSDHRVEQFI